MCSVVFKDAITLLNDVALIYYLHRKYLSPVIGCKTSHIALHYHQNVAIHLGDYIKRYTFVSVLTHYHTLFRNTEMQHLNLSIMCVHANL